MPILVYTYLKLGLLKETSTMIQLANRSNAFLIGVVKDVLVQMNELIFPVDFFMLNIEEESPTN